MCSSDLSECRIKSCGAVELDHGFGWGVCAYAAFVPYAFDDDRVIALGVGGEVCTHCDLSVIVEMCDGSQVQFAELYDSCSRGRLDG